MAVVPLHASRIALPSSLRSIPIPSLLPPSIRLQYDEPRHFLRDSFSVEVLNLTRPLARPKVSGPRAEYIKLLARMKEVGMVDFTATPLAVNGMFAVEKDAESDRLIIDAQPANRLFVDPPHVSLPNPSHLVQLHVPRGAKLHCAKSDLSNFYHQLRLPKAWQPYFALPPLTAQEAHELGVEGHTLYPMCTTLPMGFSHAVYIAQQVHEHVLYSSHALSPLDNILALQSPLIDRCLHCIYIDDLLLFSTDFACVDSAFTACLKAYAAVGIPDSPKKRQPPSPTPNTIKGIGITVDGDKLTLSIAVEDRLALIKDTLSLLRAPRVTGKRLSCLIGSWTWCLLLRRSALSVLQHVYRYIAVAQDNSFTLWPSVRNELIQLMCLAPSLSTNLAAPFHTHAYATDASSEAAGVVHTPLTHELACTLYPVSSQPAFNLLPLLHSHLTAPPSSPASSVPLSVPSYISSVIEGVSSRLSSSTWSVIVSSAWRYTQHINGLELHAAALALRHMLSSPGSLSSRVFLILDSSVAFYSLWRGRSSSTALLPVIRQINSLLLVSGVALQPCWVPSQWNPADAPSRFRANASSQTASSNQQSAAGATSTLLFRFR